MTPHRRLRPFALLVLCAACSAAVFAGSASAQIGEHLLPPLEDALDPLELTPTPLPSTLPTESPGEILDGAGDTLDDTLDDTLGSLDEGEGGGDDGGTGTDPTIDDPGPGGNGDPGDPGDPDGSTDDPAGGITDAGGIGPGSGGRDGSSVSLSGSADAPESYGSAAVRATLATATRAIRLAGPLAAPLIFGMLAVAGLIMLGRGSEGLVKIEHHQDGARSFRL